MGYFLTQAKKHQMAKSIYNYGLAAVTDEAGKKVSREVTNKSLKEAAVEAPSGRDRQAHIDRSI